jgi:iron(II)-dependent oxidoreductase
VLAALDQARERTLALVSHLDDEHLERTHSSIMSPLVWDLAHIAAYEDLWLAHRLGGLELLRGDLADRYDAFETPRAMRSQIPLLDAPQARAYMEAVRARVAAMLGEQGTGDGVICEVVVRHELQHTETMRQALAIAGLLGAGEPPLGEMRSPPGWIELAAGAFAMGADAGGFAYDNERPRHLVEVPAFRIARRPVSNESLLRFEQDGGYARREWWSPEGWAWRGEQQVTVHPSIAAGPPQAPACHVSFFEAEAFARAHDARLPTEAEWEKAARVAQDLHAEDAREEGRRGSLHAVGQVWEWTASSFRGYPGFRAHPYREYSEVFFGDDYRVLRGSSWATAPRVAGVTFRNWDLPQRRQIFAGVRLARNAA